jgi:hypothetical protein
MRSFPLQCIEGQAERVYTPAAAEVPRAARSDRRENPTAADTAWEYREEGRSEGEIESSTYRESIPAGERQRAYR